MAKETYFIDVFIENTGSWYCNDRYGYLYSSSNELVAGIIYNDNTAQRDARVSLAYYSGILYRNFLTYASKPAKFLYNLPKNLTARYTHALCAV